MKTSPIRKCGSLGDAPASRRTVVVGHTLCTRRCHPCKKMVYNDWLVMVATGWTGRGIAADEVTLAGGRGRMNREPSTVPVPHRTARHREDVRRWVCRRGGSAVLFSYMYIYKSVCSCACVGGVLRSSQPVSEKRDMQLRAIRRLVQSDSGRQIILKNGNGMTKKQKK